MRGRILCTECATREVGMPASSSPAEPRRLSKVPSIAAASLFAIGLLATIAPWDRFGILTSMFSAWRPEPEPWPLVASLSLLAGTLAGLAIFAPSMRRLTRYSGAGCTILGIVAGAATARALFGAPSYVIHTPAPYLVLSASLAILALGIVMILRRIP